MSVTLPTGSPAWLLGLSILSGIAVSMLVWFVRALKATMPQQSTDRLDWWREQLAHRRWRTSASTSSPDRDITRQKRRGENQRRQAERPARELTSQRIVIVCDLADRLAERRAAAAGVDRAREYSRSLLEQALMDGKLLEAEAQTILNRAERSYEETYRQALLAGWSSFELRAMGYPENPCSTI
jgi:hypothetical protein